MHTTAISGPARFLAACAVAAAMPWAQAAPVESGEADLKDANHLLLGSWTWTRDENQCTEIYEYRADGTNHIVSGEERTDNRYKLSAAKTEDGFYTLTSTVVKDHGGKDCADADNDDTGATFTVYVTFTPEGDQHLVCFEENLKRCFGPLRRLEK
jgi:hypothetical protein